MSSIIFVMNKEQADDLQKFWGDKFPMMCMTECAELQEAICKLDMSPYHPYQKEKKEVLKEEIRDVIIGISGLMARYDITDTDINELIVAKLKEDK